MNPVMEPVSAGVEEWGVAEVVAFFERCRFPTAGVLAGEIDGKTLLELCADEDAEAIFTAAAPDGLGFNRLMFIGRFRTEMALLRAAAQQREGGAAGRQAVIAIPRKAVLAAEKRRVVARTRGGALPTVAEAHFESMRAFLRRV